MMHTPRLGSTGVIALALLLQMSCDSNGSASKKKQADASAADAGKARSLPWRFNAPLSYDLVLKTLSQAGQSPMPLLITLSARLVVEFREEGPKRLALVRLVEPQLVDYAGRPLEGAKDLQAELAVPFGLEFESGQLVAYFDGPGQGYVTVGFRQQIAAALQLPEESAATTFQEEEWDATGLAKVEYKRDATNEHRWDWKKLSYEKVVVSKSSVAQGIETEDVRPQIDKSTGSLEVDASGLLKLKRHEELRVPAAAQKDIRVQTNLSVERSKAAPELSKVPWDETFDGKRRRTVGTPVAPTQRSNYDEVLAGGRKFPDVVQDLKKLQAKESAPVNERSTLFQALIGIFRLEPETVVQAQKLIVAQDPVSDVLLDALAMASSKESIHALGELAFDKDLSKARQARAAVSLIRAPRPNEECLQLAERMIVSPTLNEHGLLGLGTFIRLWRKGGENALAARGISTLRRSLTEARKSARASERIMPLLAIANSGDVSFYELVLPDQDNADKAVREASIQAVRLMEDPRIEPRLVELAGRKSKHDVRAALHALGRRTIAFKTTVDMVEKIALSDENADVRRAAVLSLIGWLDRWPSVKTTISTVAEKDSDQKVRVAAGRGADPASSP